MENSKTEKVIPILEPSAENIQRAVNALIKGELVAMPTETVYGLAADALNPLALAKIFSTKQRPTFDPLIVHIHDLKELELLVTTVGPKARKLMEHFWPGPLTLVLPKKAVVPDLCTSGLASVAVRMPSHPVAKSLLKAYGKPLAAPSANLFGHLSPTCPEHIQEQFQSGIECILDGGTCEIGVESTVISLLDEEIPMMLRPGGVELEAIQSCIGAVHVGGGQETQLQAPGQLENHYAPRTPLKIWYDSQKNSPDINRDFSRCGFLAFSTCPPFFKTCKHRYFLSLKADLHEAAANLFSKLHEMDNLGLDCIYTENVPDWGLGLAINDRLKRAAASTK